MCTNFISIFTVDSLKFESLRQKPLSFRSRGRHHQCHQFASLMVSQIFSCLGFYLSSYISYATYMYVMVLLSYFTCNTEELPTLWDFSTTNNNNEAFLLSRWGWVCEFFFSFISIKHHIIS